MRPVNHLGDDVASHGSPTRPSHGPASKSTQCFAARQPFAHRRGWHSDSTAAQSQGMVSADSRPIKLFACQGGNETGKPSHLP